MDRLAFRHARHATRCVLIAFLCAATLSASGCVPMVFTVAYLLRGTTEPAEFDGLKGKKVAVICRAPATMTQDQTIGCRELAARLNYLLTASRTKIEVIDQKKVADWTDENNLEDFAEIGKALEADMVLAIEVESFSLQRSASVYQGQATYTIKVIDVKDHGKVVFEKHPGQSVWPPSGGYPISKPKVQFRRAYVDVLADEIGRCFYPHERSAGYAKDADGLDFS